MKLNFKFNDRNSKLALINGRVAVLGVLASLATVIVWIVVAFQFKNENLKINLKAFDSWTIVLGIIGVAAGIWFIISSRLLEKNNSNGLLLGVGVSTTLAGLAVFIISLMFVLSDFNRTEYIYVLIGVVGLLFVLLLIPMFVSINKISKNI